MINEVAKELFLEQAKDTNAVHDKICREALIKFIKDLRFAMFCNYFCGDFSEDAVTKYLQDSYLNLKESLGNLFSTHKKEIDTFYNSLTYIRELLLLDIEAIYLGDPAANSYDEIVSTYPGFTAIYCYRIAHCFYEQGMKHLARLISEYAHSRTGIDINAGAKIGKSFFIDHGTGIVIGETSVIGDNCKLYQGVTLGAISLKNGRKLKDNKRHPTLLNNVVIYSGASIFGGDTVIGNNVTIGSNVEIKESVPDNTVVRGNKCLEK